MSEICWNLAGSQSEPYGFRNDLAFFTRHTKLQIHQEPSFSTQRALHAEEHARAQFS